jgi:hypothetical protein
MSSINFGSEFFHCNCFSTVTALKPQTLGQGVLGVGGIVSSIHELSGYFNVGTLCSFSRNSHFTLNPIPGVQLLLLHRFAYAAYRIMTGFIIYNYKQ